jgi:hypothetical protein
MADPKKNASPPPAFTREDLIVLNNALNEVCNGLSISDDEFETRIGYSREVARKVLKKIGKAIEAY